MKRSKSASINRIAEHRKAKGVTQQQLADAVGSHWITISKLERGVMRFTEEWRQAIAKALEVNEWDLVAGPRPLPVVHVEGVIEEGGQVLLLSEEDTRDSFQLDTHIFTHPAYRWLVVAGDAMWPWYQDGDRICIYNLPEDEIESVRGRVCVAWFEKEGGQEDATVGILERGRRPGLYTINRFGTPPMRDIKPISLAVVVMVIYYVGSDSLHESVPTADQFDTGPTH